jgi:hypothetical protein
MLGHGAAFQAIFWLRVFPASKQSPRPPQSHASRTRTVGPLNTHNFDKRNNMSKKSSLPKSPKKPSGKDEQNNPSALPGWPGYRTREGRSGYDPIDTRTEAAHTFGTIIQKLFTGQIRNPIYLFLLGVFGLVLIVPLVLTISQSMNGNLFSWDAWIFLLIAGIVGAAILINFIKNLIKVVFR